MRPAWFAVLDDEDQTFFRNSTRAVLPCLEMDQPWDIRPLDALGAGVLRCGYCEAQVLDDKGTPGPWVQCGAVARLDPEGGLLCDEHYAALWLCARCGVHLPVWTPPNRDAYCSECCPEVHDAEIRADLEAWGFHLPDRWADEVDPWSEDEAP